MGKAKARQKPKFAQTLSGVTEMFQDVRKDYEWNTANIRRMEQLTQDYLHKLELGDLDYKERAKVATALARCRQLRRASKDTVEVLEPLVQFLDSEKGRQMANLLNEVKGKIRRTEERMETRVYLNRVLDEEPIWN